MSFADIINQEQKKLESQGGSGEKVQYPTSKHKKLFLSKDNPKVFIQVLPAADPLNNPFFVPIRTVFLKTLSSQGKEIKSSFVLDPEQNPGSLLDNKLTEWAERQMIPNGFGGQTSATLKYLVNAVKVIQNPANPQQWVQERDANGQLVVRILEMPQSALSNLIIKLKNEKLNTSGTPLSFMDVNRPLPIEITKPPKGKMEYTVDVYTNIPLPPLGVGWEAQLEDLQAHAVPTERLVNGMQWVQAFVDMKEGRKPGGQAAPTAPQTPAANPYAQAPVNPYEQATANPYAQTQVPQQPVNPYAQQPATPPANPYAQVGQPEVPAQPVNPYAQVPQAPVTPPAPPVNPYEPVTQPANPYAQVQTPQQPVINMPSGMDESVDVGVETDLSQPPVTPTPAAPPVPPTYTAPQVPTTPAAPVAPTQPGAPGVPMHNLTPNSNGLSNIDDMLDKALGGGQ